MLFAQPKAIACNASQTLHQLAFPATLEVSSTAIKLALYAVSIVRRALMPIHHNVHHVPSGSLFRMAHVSMLLQLFVEVTARLARTMTH